MARPQGTGVRLEDVRGIYTRLAGHYDLSVAILDIFMARRLFHYRREAVRALGLRPGQRVLDMACGTGQNFPLLVEAVGPEGMVIGLDCTPAMLAVARERARRHGWHNIDLLEVDAARLELAEGVHGVLCAFGLSIIPDYEGAVRRGLEALVEGGRFVSLDVKTTRGPLRLLNPLAVLISRPYEGNYQLARRRPWEALQRHGADFQMREYFLGFIYLARVTRR